MFGTYLCVSGYVSGMFVFVGVLLVGRDGEVVMF